MKPPATGRWKDAVDAACRAGLFERAAVERAAELAARRGMTPEAFREVAVLATGAALGEPEAKRAVEGMMDANAEDETAARGRLWRG